MPWIKSPFNGAVIQVTDNSPLLRNSQVVPNPNQTNAPKKDRPVQIESASQTAAQKVQSNQDRRRAEVALLTVSNIAEVAKLQRMSQDIYVQTGEWNSKEQKLLHQKAEEIRLGTNPMYPGTPEGAGENKFFLPGPPNTILQDATAGARSMASFTGVALILGAVVLMSGRRG